MLLMNNKIVIDRKSLKKESHKNLKATYLKSILVIFIFTLIMTGGYHFSTSFANNYNVDYYNNGIKRNFDTVDKLINEEIKKEGKYNQIDEVKSKHAKGVLAPIINKATADKSAIVSFVNTFRLFYYDHKIDAGLLSLFSGIILLLIYIFIKLVLEIGKNRYYLEARRYEETKVENFYFHIELKKQYIYRVLFS